ncbi:MAG: hypothetical protein IJ064_05455 [Bacteroidaceae bacterium]|nr:hypothetical protein [Bacteroidaceae bacterium]
MKQIDFTKMEIEVSFDGTRKLFNIAKVLGNDMKYNGSVICDIGFEELAKAIYFSDGPVDVPEQYIQPMLRVINECNYTAAVKRHLTTILNG